MAQRIPPQLVPAAPAGEASRLQGLFDEDAAPQQQQQKTQSRQLPAAKKQPEAEPAWPTSVPAQADAVAMLRGVASIPAGLEPLKDLLLPTVSEDLRLFLRPDVELPQEYELLLRAVVMRWRVSVALHQRRVNPGQAVDGAEAEALFAGLDTVLQELRAGAMVAEPLVQGDLEAERMNLAKAAVDLAESVQQASQTEAKQAVVQSAERYKHVPSARMLANTAAVPEPAGLGLRRFVLPAVLVVLLGVAGVRMFWPSSIHKTQAGPVALTEDGLLRIEPRTGPHTIRSVKGTPLSKETLATLEKEASVKGRVLRVVSPSMVMLVKDAQQEGTP